MPWRVCPDPRWTGARGPYAKASIGDFSSPTGSIVKRYEGESTRGADIYEHALTEPVWNRDERVPNESPWREDD